MSARLDALTKRGVTVGDVYGIGANRWRVVRLSHTRAWCEPAEARGPSARWLYLDVLTATTRIDPPPPEAPCQTKTTR